MVEQFLASAMEQGFNVFLLCSGLYYMHKRVEKIEKQKDALIKRLMELVEQTNDTIDRFSDNIEKLID